MDIRETIQEMSRRTQIINCAALRRLETAEERRREALHQYIERTQQRNAQAYRAIFG